MENLFQRSREKLERYFIYILVFATSSVALCIVGIFGLVLAHEFGEIDISWKRNVAEGLLGGTLALGALALTVLGFSVSQMRLRRLPNERRPYKRIGYMVFFIIPLSMADSFTSAVFLLTENPISFLVSFVLLFVIAVGVVVSVSLWAIRELK